MSDFTAIGQLVTEARNLLDSIKGGAIRTMQTTFDNAYCLRLIHAVNGMAVNNHGIAKMKLSRLTWSCSDSITCKQLFEELYCLKHTTVKVLIPMSYQLIHMAIKVSSPFRMGVRVDPATMLIIKQDRDSG